MKANGVAVRPAIEILAPSIHLRGRDAFRFVDKRSQDFRLVPTRLPQCSGKLVRMSESFCDVLHLSHRDPKGLVRWDRISSHPLATPLSSASFYHSDYFSALSSTRSLVAAFAF